MYLDIHALAQKWLKWWYFIFYK